MSKFEEWWKTHRYEWEFTDEEEGLALIAAEHAWDAAIDEAVKVAETLIESHIKDTGNECGEDNDYCDFLIAWRTLANNIEELKK